MLFRFLLLFLSNLGHLRYAEGDITLPRRYGTIQNGLTVQRRRILLCLSNKTQNSLFRRSIVISDVPSLTIRRAGSHPRIPANPLHQRAGLEEEGRCPT